MPATLSTKAVEKSTYIVNVAFTDDDGDPVVPDSIAWSLTDDAGTAINSRTSVSVTVPAASYDIVLSGLDLAMQTGETGYVKRVLTVEAVYDSDAGQNLPLKDQAVFILTDLVKVT